MRARGIKPGIFKNEALAEIDPPWGRALFIGLWGLADREGRLLDRPGHIAVEIFPYDLAKGRLSISQVEEMLVELSKGSDPFILRYEVAVKRLSRSSISKNINHPTTPKKPQNCLNIRLLGKRSVPKKQRWIHQSLTVEIALTPDS